MADCELAICNFTKGPWRPGYVVAVKECPTEWGKEECPPNWLILRVRDADRVNLEAMLYEPWRTNRYKVTEQLGELGTKAQIVIEQDATDVSATGLNAEFAIHDEMEAYLQEFYGAVLVTKESTKLVVEMSKDAVGTLSHIKGDLDGEFAKTKDLRLVYVEPIEVTKLIKEKAPVVSLRDFHLMLHNRLDD